MSQTLDSTNVETNNANPAIMETHSSSGISTSFGDVTVKSDEEDKIPAQQFTSKRIMKNIVVISLVFFLNFTAYGGLSALQSSLHIDEGMGVITQSALYATMLVSCLFIPKLVIRKFGHKYCIAFSIFGYILWMAANGYAVWGTMVPASMLVGVCAAPLWTAQCAYFTFAAKEYAKQTSQNEDGVVALFFGIFFMIFQSSGLFGSIISSTVLRQAPPENYTGPSDEELALCGINDCPGNNVTNVNLEKPEESLVWTMVGIYIAIALCGVATAFIFIDPLPKHLEPREDMTAKQEIIDGLWATVKHLKLRHQIFMIPLTIYSGIEQTMKGAEWNRSFVACNLGIWMIGLITIPYALTDAIVSFFGGGVVKVAGRIPVFTAGLLIDVGIILTWIFWTPDPGNLGPFITIQSFAGMADGVWQTQINAMYSVLFPFAPEAAFSNYRFWESLGFVMGFAYSNFLCTSVKLGIMIAFLVLGIILYYIVEAELRIKNRTTLELEDKVGGDGMEHGVGEGKNSYEL